MLREIRGLLNVQIHTYCLNNQIKEYLKPTEPCHRGRTQTDRDIDEAGKVWMKNTEVRVTERQSCNAVDVFFSLQVTERDS